jgi:23S rRNA (adenine2030-N6)-methyltransferase
VNYRHAFHAGNFADVMKHALLVRILVHLRRKETPFRVVDTHAGIGFYDLEADEAARTGEWQDGIGRIEEPFAAEVEELLQPYRAVLADVQARRGASVYPGSPAIIREMLRHEDRAIFLEMHPEDGELLSERFNEVRNTKVMRLDGWVGLYGLIPPKERRGLVLIDPPYEEPDELARAVPRLARAVEKWPTGIFAFWYPIKDRRETDRFAAAIGKTVGREALRLELLVDAPADRTRLNGSGLLVVNPPWTLAKEAETILPAFAERLARTRYGAYLCERLAQGS